MRTTNGADSGAFARMTRGEAAYAGVSLTLDERMRDAARARMAVRTDVSGRSLRTRAGLAIVALGTRVGGRALDRTIADTLPSSGLPRQA